MIRHMTIRDRKIYPELFRSMHEDRKRVFVDTLKWDLDHDGFCEQDQYDTADAQYLILRDEETSEHLGSVRLLPTIRGHILGDVFPFLCSAAVPCGPEIWEITRLVVSPRVNRSDRLMIRNMLGRAMIEYGQLVGIEKYTAVCEIGFLSQLLASGWRCDPLGLPQKVGKSTIGALLIHNDLDSLSRTNAAWRFGSPALRVVGRENLAA